MQEQLSAEERQKLSSWEAQAPSDDFAARVTSSLHAPKRRLWVAALSVAAMLSLLFWMWPNPETKRGALSAEHRQEVSLGGRAIAVLESGAALQWEVAPDNTATIVQAQGDVFYRVEPGGAFVVKTDLGDVTVKGTCFRVEVTPMKQALLGGAIGAAVSTLITVSVYEGKVALANEKGAMTLTAGESASISPAKAPEKGGPPERGPMKKVIALAPEPIAAPTNETTREELLRRDAQMREQIAMLQNKVQELESAPPPKDDLREKNWWFEPSQEDLLQMAKDCRLPWDEPPDMSSPEDLAELSKELKLSPEEIDAMKTAQSNVQASYSKQLHELYLEVLGAAAPDDMDPNAMIQEMEAKSNKSDIEMANYLITQERAGLKTPPTNLASRPPIEQALRLRIGLGDAFEEALATVIGKDHAHELRGKGKGWPRRAMMMGGCGSLNEPK